MGPLEQFKLFDLLVKSCNYFRHTFVAVYASGMWLQPLFSNKLKIFFEEDLDILSLFNEMLLKLSI